MEEGRRQEMGEERFAAAKTEFERLAAVTEKAEEERASAEIAKDEEGRPEEWVEMVSPIDGEIFRLHLTAAEVEAEVGERDLPAGWVEIIGRGPPVFYANVVTKKTQIEKPERCPWR